MAKRVPAHAAKKPRRTPPLSKAPPGIQGLDELTGGGLPKGRPTLLCGRAGCGKTLMAMEFLVRGALDSGEPGVFMAFEESGEELATNFASLGHDLPALVAKKKLSIEFVLIERNEMAETGAYDLEGLFIRLGHAIDSIGAKRVVLDTLEVLFSGLSDDALLRRELQRLFRWLKARGVTAIITAEKGDDGLTRHGLEECVADRVIVLDHRVEGQMATRRMRIVKYRGSTHGTNEYPFLIDEGGISILPITSAGLEQKAGIDRVSSEVPRLDSMMGGKGYYRGSTVLVSGTAGSGKTSLAARDATHRSGAVHDLGPGDAPRHHPQAGEGVQAERGHHRRGLELGHAGEWSPWRAAGWSEAASCRYSPWSGASCGVAWKALVSKPCPRRRT